MFTRKLALIAGAAMLVMGQSALAQEELTCDDIEWSSNVTDQVPTIADACDAVVMKNGKMFARVQVEVRRARGRNITFRILNNDGSFGGTYTQTVDMNWRAKVGGQSLRSDELLRGQELNVYLPGDRWAIIHEDDDGPDEADAVEVVAAAVLPETASPLPLLASLGLGLAGLGAAFGAVRRRLA